MSNKPLKFIPYDEIPDLFKLEVIFISHDDETYKLALDSLLARVGYKTEIKEKQVGIVVPPIEDVL